MISSQTAIASTLTPGIPRTFSHPIRSLYSIFDKFRRYLESFRISILFLDHKASFRMPSLTNPYWLPRTIAMLLCALASPFLFGPAIGELCSSIVHEYRSNPSSGSLLELPKLAVKLWFAVYGALTTHRSLWRWFQEVCLGSFRTDWNSLECSLTNIPTYYVELGCMEFPAGATAA